MPLGTKIKTQSPEFEKSFLRLSQLLSPKPTKRDIASFGGTRSVSMPKTGCNWNDGTAEPTPSSGNDPRISTECHRLAWLGTVLDRLDKPSLSKGFQEELVDRRHSSFTTTILPWKPPASCILMASARSSKRKIAATGGSMAFSATSANTASIASCVGLFEKKPVR